MAHQQAYRAADAGKHRGNKATVTSDTFLTIRRLLIAAVVLFAASLSSPPVHAQAGPFTGMAGRWAGGGSVTLDDGSSERLRCRTSEGVGAGGNALNIQLTCASDSYKFDLAGHVVADHGALTGTWSEASRNINGTLEGRGGGGNFEVTAAAAGFVAGLSISTRGNRQSIAIRSQSGFRGANISLARR